MPVHGRENRAIGIRTKAWTPISEGKGEVINQATPPATGEKLFSHHRTPPSGTQAPFLDDDLPSRPHYAYFPSGATAPNLSRVTVWVDILPKAGILGLYLYPKGERPAGAVARHAGQVPP